MSVGSFFGAVAGGIIGFVVTGGNPWGALYGASIGFGLGMAIDPMTPDMPSVGAPDQMTQVMSSTVGDPVPDLAGTGKIAGHLLCYGKERAEPVYSTSSGGGGKGGPPEPQPQITGYKYYMSWVLGIVAGPVDTLYAIYKGEDVVWEGELNCPASGGKETIVLSGIGSVDFCFGTADQVANSKVGEIISDATLNTPYRNMCWAFFDDCYIGEYNRTPTMKFIVKKIPENAFSTKHEIQAYDSNPAHVMWYILHDLTGLPESWLYSADFAAIASTLYSECRGISVLFDRQQNALNYLESINNHIDNIIRYDIDGKFHPKLIRDDYTVGDLPLIDENVMLDESTFNRKSWIDTLNEMKVQYSEILADRPKPFGPIWGTGYNFYGNLGTGDTTDLYIFTELEALNYQKICCGHQNSIIILSNGNLWGAGWNTVGQLGLGDNTNRLTFVEISIDSWQDGDGGYQFNMFLKSDRTLWGSGRNEFYGQLGLGDYVNRNTLTQCLTGVKDVATGTYNTLALKIDGTLWGTGRNDSGELGLNNLTNRNTFAQEFGGSSLWQSVFGGANHTMALRSDGSLWGTGSNYYGEMGLNDNSVRKVFTQEVGLSSWKKVSCKGSFTIAIKTDGTLWGTGKNNHHQLGLGDTTDRWIFTQIGTDADWSDVFCGAGSTTVMKSTGALWGFGYNQNYALGLNHSNEVQVPTDLSINVLQAACGASHTVVIKK